MKLGFSQRASKYEVSLSFFCETIKEKEDWEILEKKKKKCIFSKFIINFTHSWYILFFISN